MLTPPQISSLGKHDETLEHKWVTLYQRSMLLYFQSVELPPKDS